MINNEQDLQELVQRARQADSVALDTEFVWERTYYPKLGLIQLALSDEDCHLIDPLAVRDLTPLGPLLADRNVVKILHDAPQDLVILGRVTKAVPVNIFDTRIAAGFSGLSSTISLADLISILLDIDLLKTQTRTNWLKRPLNAAQIDYALDDVRYLRAARVLLLTRIIVPEIKQWLKAELDGLNTPQNYMGVDDHERFRKIKGSGSLDESGLAVLKELAAWREQKARETDKPRNHIITDKTLLNIAGAEIDSYDDLAGSGLLSDKKLRQYGRAISTHLEIGRSCPPEERPKKIRVARLGAREQAAYERLSSFVRLKCDMQGIDPQLVGSTTELKLLAKNLNSRSSPLPERLTDGWRKALLEEFFRLRH